MMDTSSSGEEESLSLSCHPRLSQMVETRCVNKRYPRNVLFSDIGIITHATTKDKKFIDMENNRHREKVLLSYFHLNSHT